MLSWSAAQAKGLTEPDGLFFSFLIKESFWFPELFEF